MNRIERTPLDSDLLHTFATIAASGTLTAAAHRMGRTQSAISVQLRKLEDSLGTSLFKRGARGMALTDAGETLLSRAQPILADLREAADLFLAPLTGSIRVGLPDDFDEALMERILSQFAQTHPGVRVMARSGCTAGYPAAIGSGELDVAVCSGLTDQAGELLRVEAIDWVARAGTHLSADAPVPLAVLDRACYWRDLPATALNRAGRPHHVAFQSSSFESIKAAIRSGLAVGILPRSCVGPGLTALNQKQGFPDLPAARRYIQLSAHAPQKLAEAMVQAIQLARHL